MLQNLSISIDLSKYCYCYNVLFMTIISTTDFTEPFGQEMFLLISAMYGYNFDLEGMFKGNFIFFSSNDRT